MGTVAITAPKTPITSGFNKGTAKNTLPNVCKMPGPPAPFVPSPLPNIAKSNMSPKGYSKKVKIEGNTVAIFGASFKSMGDIASKATGGGLISMNTHGPTKFIVPGCLTVSIEGKPVHLKGDMVLNNVGAAGMPPNTGATMSGTDRDTANVPDGDGAVHEIECNVEESAKKDWDDCQMKQFCAKLDAVNKQNNRGAFNRPVQARDSARGEGRFRKQWNQAPLSFEPMRSKFYDPCAFDKAAENDFQIGSEFQPDHVHELQLGGAPTNFKNLKWLDKSVNLSLGSHLKAYDPQATPGGVNADCCS